MIDFSGLKILVIGDPILDAYVFGRVERVSPEAPVPVFIPERREVRMGGAANVEAQLIALGVETESCWTDETEEWTRKERYMVGSHQLLRVDEDCWVPAQGFSAAGDYDAVVISDYAKGACTPIVCQTAIRSSAPVIVDPKGKDWTKYRGCTVICPNQHEVNGNEGFNIIEKRGAHGLRYRGRDYPSTARRVFDVTGAGDTVTAVIAACVAKNIDPAEACKLANLAAGYVVGEVGTTVCPIEKLRELCG